MERDIDEMTESKRVRKNRTLVEMFLLGAQGTSSVQVPVSSLDPSRAFDLRASVEGWWGLPNPTDHSTDEGDRNCVHFLRHDGVILELWYREGLPDVDEYLELDLDLLNSDRLAEALAHLYSAIGCYTPQAASAASIGPERGRGGTSSASRIDEELSRIVAANEAAEARRKSHEIRRWHRYQENLALVADFMARDVNPPASTPDGWNLPFDITVHNYVRPMHSNHRQLLQRSDGLIRDYVEYWHGWDAGTEWRWTGWADLAEVEPTDLARALAMLLPRDN